MSCVESFVLLGIAIFIIVVRSAYRWHQVGFRGYQLDDHLMPVSGVLCAVLTFFAYAVGQKYHGLSNGFMTDEQRETLDLNSEEAFIRIMGSKIQVVGWSVYALELWLIKLCITAFYARLFTRLSNLGMQVKIAYVAIGVSYVVVTLAVLLGCQPFRHNWQIKPDPGPLCQPTNSRLNVLMVYIFNVLTDLHLLSIPLPLLWHVNISLRRKLTLMLLFGGAVFVIAAATVRAVLVLTAGPEGSLYASQWGCREIFVSIVVSNLPVIQPMLRKLASRAGMSVLFSHSGGRSVHHDRDHGLVSTVGRFSTLPSRSASHRGGSGPARGCNDTRQAPTVSAAAWASDERILVSDLGERPGGDEPYVGQVRGGHVGEMAIMVGKEVRVMSECVDLESQSVSISSEDSRTEEGWDNNKGDETR
ncbi:uncharacterized protein B0I36DRAFT_409779 [Microdochium trichocladiopsis]|uniref:Rhodopsin domain-containing protein n=1 Tax=Microdochium trichocladiopsis TaxID=1682393 RepID=A0A9P9BR28_9PEZI|nr:uncharacterized protein B0I36DRAFT_409779 [Microdochium trichocladiopsis]KAH7031430.1 hypothetical protein B0I36DRAFT_409779 [Microdochium trichocladiopsis]